ncbi:hypothetical protein AMECASPLE_023105 [Ameca splendens]|uniref:PHD-type domain-containing protein n=1 Tax=Ameca splendens TaxID=208324 RepID=A0ABV0XGZ8_9TELE
MYFLHFQMKGQDVQNLGLYSSGIFCTNTPQFDDLFGFSVEDVLKEVKRGGKLCCGRCGRKGATAGCEVKRCKKTFHYPCAVEEGAKTFEDNDNETYGLYCLNHSRLVNSSSVNEPKTPPSSRNPSGTGSSRVCIHFYQLWIFEYRIFRTIRRT